MRYVPRSGVTLTKICDVFFLVSTRDASEHCPIISHPGIFELMCWEGVTKGKTADELCAVTERAFKRTPEQAKRIIGNALGSLVEKGYLTEEIESL